MIGQTISHYRILEKLGEGGMGVVYKAEDTKLRRAVALKFVSPQMLGAPETKSRFLHEAQTAASLSHPNVCTVYEIDEVDGQVFLAMEFVEGRTLDHKIASGPLKLAEALGIAAQVAEALQAAHTAGVVHRDVKPGNIMLLPTGRVKILDFGLAITRQQTRLTRPGTTLGTIAYMSPEQASGEPADHQSDIWALGVILYEMVTGQLPFPGEHEQAILYSILNATPENVTGLRTGVPIELERIIGKALEPAKAHRYQHVDELLADLGRLQPELEAAEAAGRTTPVPGTTISAPPRAATPPRPRRRPPRAILLPVAVIAILAVAFLFLRPILFDQIAISEPTPIAVISFTNQTGDSSYDYLQEAIPNLLITSLEQSPYLRVATWERMQDVLAQMGRPGMDVIDRDLGFEVCRHEGIHTIVLGSFVKAGEVFATDVKVLDVDSKTLLKSASARGRGVGSILETQIDELSREIFRATGLSERRIAATQPPIADVTTRSMEAYDHFLKGRKALQQFYAADAKRYLEKAVAIDSTFAVAHLCLAITYGSLYDQRAEARAYRKAMALADQASEKERLYIEALFAWEIERDSEKQFRTLEKLVAKYPQNKQAHLSLGRYYDREERHPEAIRSFQEALKLDPDYGLALNHIAYGYASMDSFEAAIRWVERYAAVAPEDANAYDSMGDFYHILGRLDESVAAYKEALDIKPDFRSSARKLAHIALISERYDEAGYWLERFATMTPGAGMVGEGVWWKAHLHFTRARYGAALEELTRAEQLSESVDFALGKQLSLWLRSWVYYEQGELELSRETNDEWVAYGLQHYPQTTLYPVTHAYRAGLIDLREGRPDAVRARIVEIEEFTNRTKSDRAREFYRYRRGLLEAELLMAQGSLDAALTIARELAPLEIHSRNTQIDLLANPWIAEDVLGRICAAQGALDEAVTEYELLTASDPNRRGRRFVHPLYHYRLASLYEEQGSQPAARREYEKFLDIWKDADEGRAEVDDARARLAILQAVSR